MGRGWGWGGSRGGKGPLAPITLFSRRLGDDAHAGGAAAQVAATGGTEAAGAGAIGEATAVAAPSHTEAAAPTVACSTRGGDHGCGEKARSTLAASSSFSRPILPRAGARGAPSHCTSSGNRNLLCLPGARVRGWARTPVSNTHCLSVSICTGHHTFQSPFTAVNSLISTGLRGCYDYELPHFTEEKLEAQRDQAWASPRSALPETKALGSHMAFLHHLYTRGSH